MTKEVVVTISGLQLSDGDQDTIETVHVGEYHEKDGVHYVFFDEILEGHEQPVRNMIKLGERSVCHLEHVLFLSTHPVSA